MVAKYRLGGITAWTLGMEDPTATAAVRQVAQSIAPDLVVSILNADQSTLSYGNPVKVTGQLLLPDKTPVSGVTVRLELLPSGESTWREVLQVITGIDGTISVPVILSKASALRISTDASWERLASQSASLPIAISRLLTISSPASSAIGGPIAISGRVQPHEGGVLLTLEKYVAGRWMQAVKPTLTVEDGSFSFLTSEAVRGFARYRVRADGNANLSGATSPIFSVVVY